ncbi:hypothetical protein [Halalkalicoccus subterraneus]|uniref:hypothetical protein n=1 Tax=Halalkalicoccus subterraneus TaxID=2675002 RepID=UPI000EFC0AE1|nr:hypothetical protein [Halalkalicoccus subterraneus]
MRRRTVLGLTAASLLCVPGAGCLGDGSSGAGNDGSTDILYTVSVAIAEESPTENLPLELGFDVRRESITEDDPFGIEFALRNEGDEPIEVSSGAPWPFGVPWLEPTDASDEPGVTLWTDAYEKSSHVGTNGRHVTAVQDIGLVEELEGGESVTRTYELYSDTPGLEPETYRFRIGVGARSGEVSEGAAFYFELVVSDGSETSD